MTVKNPSPRTFKKNLAATRQWLQQSHLADQLSLVTALGFGSGLSGKAPGTAGSLAALLLVPLWMQINPVVSLALLGVGTLIGIPVCQRAANTMQVHDDGRIVWDEWMGQSLAFLPLMFNHQWHWYWILTGFVLFRFFDILKPWPVSWLDKNLHGGVGIMLDDIAAGLMAAISLFLLTQHIKIPL